MLPHDMSDRHGIKRASSASLLVLRLTLSALLGVSTWHAAVAEQPTTKIKIAVFDFELEDASAAGGVIPPDANDFKYLAQSTDQAKRLLVESGRYELVPTQKADLTAAKQYGVRNCRGCEATIADKLGANQAMIGVVTRINRTEYTMLIKISDAHTGSIASTSFTNLRMGANYAWPRGAKWLMEKQVLDKPRDR